MRAEFYGAAVLICATVVAVKHFETRETAAIETPTEEEVIAAAETPAPAAESASTYYGREVRVAPGANHQYYVTAAVNATPASFLVDTGASYVALRDSDARAANIYVSWADYKHAVRTANGETKAALVEVDAIEIDGIRVENVKTFILPDEQLGVNLLGMSFLSRLESVEQRGGELVLKG